MRFNSKSDFPKKLDGFLKFNTDCLRFLITKTVNSDGYGSLPGGRTLRYKGDTYSISGTKVTVNQKVRKYVRVQIAYFTNGLFDPSVK